ncbi:MAG: long-chain fatty acid--CoA ligase [Alphaproteobacteria bacterium]|nr:long-chain fatty acid--CoA ligase [Alphaproteobacteria bacterium]
MADGQRLDRMLRDACASFAARPAAADREEALTYAALDALADETAARLARAGIAPDEPVLAAVSNRARDLAGLVGIWRAGGVAVPLHRGAVAATAASVRARVGARLAVNLRGDLPAPAGLAGADGVLALGGDAPAARPLLADAAWIVTTSGSTGAPKGVVHAHATYAAKLAMIQSMTGFAPGERVLLVLQLNFSFGQWVALLTLLNGGTLVLRDRFEPEAMLADLAAVDRAGVVPTMLRRLRAPLDAGGTDYAGRLMAGGEVMPAALMRWVLRRWPRARIGDIYGLTETCTCDFFVQPDEAAAAAGTIGRAGPGIAWRVAPDGELQIASPWRMRGYLDDPALTEAAYADGHFRTGDLASLRPDGRVALVGRAKEIIARAGAKVAPLEVEAAFLDHPDVAAALAAGVPDPMLGEAICLFLVPRGGATLDPARLRDWARERLDRYKLPDRIMLGEALPVGATGKADRGALRRLAGETGPEC